MKKSCFLIAALLSFNIMSYAEDTITYYGLSNGDKVISNINFKDLQNKPEEYWSKPAIYQMAAFGVVSGFSDKTFLPSSPITNEQAITLLLNATGKLDEVNAITNVTNNDSWSDKYIRYAIKNGIVTEKIVMKKSDVKPSVSIDSLKNAGVLIRDIPITREEVAGMIARTLNLTGTNDLNFYDNSQISDNNLNYVRAVVSAGIMSGSDDNMFNPKSSLTREEMTQILKNSENYVLSSIKLIKRTGIVNAISSNNINITDEEENDININVSNRNIPVLRRGTLSGKSALKVNDKIEYYVDLNKQVKYLRVIDDGIDGSANILPINSIQGTVVSNSPYFEQITIVNKDGIKHTYTYGSYTDFYKDNIQTSAIDIVAGDTVYLELDEIENVVSIRAISNYLVNYGTIIKIDDLVVTVKSEETGEIKTYNLTNVPIYKEGIEKSYKDLKNGEYAKIYTSNTNIVKVEIVDDERTLEALYKGIISDISLIYDTITLKDTQIYENGSWTTSRNSFVTIPLDKNVDVTFYGDKISVSELGEKQVGKFAYIATRSDSKLLSKAKKISIDVYNTDKMFEGNVKSYNSYDGSIVLNKNNNEIYTDNTTIFIENDKIIDVPNITKNNKLYITAQKKDEEYIASVVNIAPYEEEKSITIYTGLLYDLEENSELTLRLFSEFYDDELYSVKKKYATFNITNNSRIFTSSGPINLREFSFDNESFDFEGMIVNLVAYGDDVIALTTVDMEDEPLLLKGTISKLNNNVVTLKSVEKYDRDEEEWVDDSRKTLNIASDTLIIKNAKVVKLAELEESQNVLIFKNASSSNQNIGIVVVL